jgi:riboflavin synthase
VKEIRHQSEMARMTIQTEGDFTRFELGESIAVNGVCLTVCQSTENSFSVDMTTETLARTGFKQVRLQSGVNLERSLTPTQKMSGHFVSGHVDQVGAVASIDHKSGEILFRFSHPPELGLYIIEKGSIAVDGISLTVFDCKNSQFTVSIIPFTFSHTNLKERKVGDTVNIECDMIGKYVVKACETLFNRSPEKAGVTPDFLKQHGFV